MGKDSLSPPSWIEIDLAQFERNLAAIRKRVGGARICIPLKANAYGHGLIEMGKAAERFGVDAIGVAFSSEGAALRKAGVRCPILMFGAFQEGQLEELLEYDLEFSISSMFKADLAAAYCTARGKKARVHIEVDTGMQRTGMRPATALSLYRQMRNRSCFEIVGIYSHLATADIPNDPFTLEQIKVFDALRGEISDPLTWHLANSGGVCFYPRSHFDLVRPGLLCYGYRPDGTEDEEIKPVFSLHSKISYFKVVAPDRGISYGHAYKTKEQTRVVTVPVGYGDGYRRALSNRASVLIGGRRFCISGRICMDQFMVDIGQHEAFVGDEVVLIGEQQGSGICLWELAKLCDTDPREILCLFNARLQRVYTENNSRIENLTKPALEICISPKGAVSADEMIEMPANSKIDS